MAKRKNAALNVAQIGVNNRALKTANRAYRRNGNEDGRSPLLKLAHLAWTAVQHEGVKQGNYDASLYFFGGLDNGAGVRRASCAHGDFFDIACLPSSMIFAAPHANTLIHNKYYCDHRGCKW
jgi:hypothetical protein